jgi:hypothetical protein
VSTSTQFCLTCGWTSKRRKAGSSRPCPNCKGHHVVTAGTHILSGTAVVDPTVDQITGYLQNDARLLWSVLRKLSTLTPVSAWVQPDGHTLERVTMEGHRVAWISKELGMYVWETETSRGFADSPEGAQHQADRSLQKDRPDYRLVAPRF